MARELCLFLTIDASKAPGKQRRDFVGLAVRRAAPFAEVDFDVAWGADGHASVWYWSRDRVRELLAGETAKRVKFVAEPLYVGALKAESTELLALKSGVEGRIWRQSRLIASRCWPASPSEADWLLFLRSAGVAPGSDPSTPLASATTISRLPWGSVSSTSAKFRVSGLEQHLPHVALVVGAAFTFVLLTQLGSTVRARVDIWQARSASTRLDASLQRIMTARENADTDVDKINSLLSLREGRSQTQLLAEAVKLMPDGQWRIRIWNQTAPDLLEVTIVAPDANPEQMVAKWEASPAFEKVTTELGRDGEVTIKANIVSGDAVAPVKGI